jgi:pyruvyl transferase EpsO
MSKDTATNDDALIRSLQEKIGAALGPLLPPGTPCALLDFPNHSNVGDSAIWLGERNWLEHQGSPLVYACDMATYSRQRLAARLGDGVILLHGGGNLGDFWTEHQQFREQVIQDFPNIQIVQLPQTIYFMDEWSIGQARRIFNQHKHLTLLCRDDQSLDFARRQFDALSLLCPDMAFALGPLERPAPPTDHILYLRRTDAESSADRIGLESLDWLDEAATPIRDRCWALSREMERQGAPWQTALTSLISTYDVLAQERLHRGCRILSRGRVVITDRLHGHILCLLLRIPHIVLDNSYGKVRSFYETWTLGHALAQWAASAAEAVALAETLGRDQSLVRSQQPLTARSSSPAITGSSHEFLS